MTKMIKRECNKCKAGYKFFMWNKWSKCTWCGEDHDKTLTKLDNKLEKILLKI